MFRFTTFVLLFGITLAGKVEFDNCGSLGVPVSVDIQGCDSTPCVLVKGRSYDVEVQFQPKSDSDGLTVNISVRSIGPAPILEKDACEGLTTGCPYKGGLLNTHKIQIPIGEDWVETDANVFYKLRNKELSGEICISLLVRIVAAPSC